MTRILVRSGKDPFDVIPPEMALELSPHGLWGRNVGNLVFTDAMHKILSVPGAEVVSNSLLSSRSRIPHEYISRIDSEFDHFVVPFANAFRPSFIGSLLRFTKVIEKLHIPVTIVGVGVSGGVGSLKHPMPRLNDEDTAVVKRFVRAALNHSASIGVRGEYTREYLASLGFGDEHVDVIGCPSLYRDGASLQVHKKTDQITPDSDFSMNLTPYVKIMGEVSLRHAAKYPKMVYIPQIYDSLSMMMWGSTPEKPRSHKLPNNLDHPLYQTNRMRYFVDSITWIRYLSGKDFSFGTRIHGNIAAILARTPAVVLAHDSRTLELARFHKIPHRLLTDVDETVDAAELHDWADYTAFNAEHAGNVENFGRFMTKNGIEHIHEPGKANPAYDEKLASIELPPPVETLTSDNPEARRAAIERVRLLRDLAGEEVFRDTYKLQHRVPLHKPHHSPYPPAAEAPVVKRRKKHEAAQAQAAASSSTSVAPKGGVAALVGRARGATRRVARRAARRLAGG